MDTCVSDLLLLPYPHLSARAIELQWIESYYLVVFVYAWTARRQTVVFSAIAYI